MKSIRHTPTVARLVIVGLLVLCCGQLSAATWYVKTTGSDSNTGQDWAHAKKTIQAGVNVASSADDVWVAAGTYQERVTLKSGVRLYGGFVGNETDFGLRDPVNNTTTIDANLTGIAVTVPASAIATTTFDGFTVRNGKGANGAGILCDSSAVVVANCIIRNNSATSSGGGVYCNNSTASFTNTTFLNNTANSNGGGLYVGSVSPAITGCTFTTNSASGSGGGIYLYQSSSALSTCVFTGNTAGGNGGGIRSESGSPSITGSTFTGNSAYNGGGIESYNGNPTLTGITFSGNSAYNGGGYYQSYGSGSIMTSTFTNCSGNVSNGYGGAISLNSANPTVAQNSISGCRAYVGAGISCRSGAPWVYSNMIYANNATNTGGGADLESLGASRFINNTLADNYAANGGGGIYSYNLASAYIYNNIVAFNASGIRVDGTVPSIENNCVYGNDSLPYQNIADQTGTNGNISADPMFGNLYTYNLHVQNTSPCVDAGDGTLVQVGWKDFEGQNRAQGAQVDIGADESDGTLLLPPPASKVIYVSPAGFDTNTGLSWDQAKLTVQAGINTAGPGDELWVAATTYVETITLKKRVSVYGGFAGTEVLRSDRNVSANTCTIDANLLGTTVTVPVGVFATAFDGFTVRNGKANSATNNYGGGLYCYSALVYLANCTFRNNSANYGAGAYFDWSPSVLTNDAFRVGAASSNGGGIYVGNAPMSVTNTLFVSNTASSGGGMYFYYSNSTATACTFSTNSVSSSGGAIRMDTSNGTITGGTFTGNTASSGGAADFYSGNPTVTNATFTTNTASNGGALNQTYGGGTITGCAFTSNSASTGSGYYGGGINAYGTSLTIANNTFADCHAFYGAGMSLRAGTPVVYNNMIRTCIATSVGGAVDLESATSAKFVNNTLVDNFASNGGGGLYCYNLSGTPVENNIIALNASGIRVDGTAPTIKNNCVYGNDAYPYMGIANQTGLNGNIAVDPVLANVSGGNLHIQPTSPCINAGDDAVVVTILTDIDGDPRTIGIKVDIGADESNGTTWPGPSPSKIIRVRTTGNDSNNGSTWALAKKTLQAAINYAAENDEIWVAGATYSENITLKKRVALYGGFAGTETLRTQRNANTNLTSINGNLLGTVITVPVGIFGTATVTGFGSTTVDGFTIRNGQAGPTTSNRGGGIYVYSASMNLANCLIRNNTASYGAGVYFDYSPSVLTNNQFMSNVASSYGGGVYCSDTAITLTSDMFSSNTCPNGAGAYITNSSTAISGNTFTGNTATSGTGGGLYLDNSSATVTTSTFTTNTANQGGGAYCSSASPSITNSTFTSNTAANGSGGGIYLYAGSGTLSGCTFSKNVSNPNNSGYRGGGIAAVYGSPTIFSNTVFENQAYGGGGIYCYGLTASVYDNMLRANIATNVGGGIYLDAVGSTKCVNNTVVDGFASNGGGGVYVNNSGSTMLHNNIVAFNASGIRVDNAAPTIKYNCVYGNDAWSYMGVGDQTGINGNISADPLLANMLGGNLHIQPTSPCKDTGDEAAVMTIMKDFDGQDRIQGVTVDIGADESDGTVWQGPAASRVIFVSTSAGNDANSGLSWALAKKTLQAGIDAANATDEVWVARGTYLESVVLKKRVAVFGGFAGTETTRSQRNWVGNQTTLDGNNAATPVTCQVGSFATTALDGFTIIRGKATSATSNYGGGMYLWSASVQIANDIFQNSSAQYGGGLFIDYSASVLTNDRFTGNSVSSQGGGFYASNAPPTLTNCVFQSNTAPTGAGVTVASSSASFAGCTWSSNVATSYGGGIYTNSASPTITGATFISNSANQGGGLYIDGSSATITNNLIKNNTAYHGAGMVLSGSPSPNVANVANNIIVSNTAHTTGNDGNGGGIYCYSTNATIAANYIEQNSSAFGAGIRCIYGTPNIYDNIIWSNTAANSGGGVSFDSTSSAKFINNSLASNKASVNGGGIHNRSGSTVVTNDIVAFNQSGVYLESGSLTLKNNCVFGNTSYQYSGLTNPTGTNGNISVDPLFANLAAGNLHVQASSPCVEAGNDDAVLTILTDIDGQDRIFAFHVDIGADESDGTVWPSSGITIGTARTYTEGAEVVLIGLSVSASFYSDQGFIYGEEQNRANGIRILTFDPFVEGEIIDVIGTIHSDPSTGEAYIIPYPGWPKHSGGFKPIVALGMDAHRIGGRAWGLQGGIPGMVGVNNIGLLVKTWGTVTSIDPSTYPAWFIITTPSGVPVRAMLPMGMALPVAIKDTVTVKGANSLELLGPNISRLIWVRKTDDVVRLLP